MSQLSNTKVLIKQESPTQTHAINLGYQNFNQLSISRISFYTPSDNLGVLFVRVGPFSNHSVNNGASSWKRYTQCMPLIDAGYAVFTQNMNTEIRPDWDGPIVRGDSVTQLEIELYTDSGGGIVPAVLDRPCYIEIHFIYSGDRPPV
jgi:hypothetical protein